LGNEIEEMGRTRGTYGGQKIYIEFWWGVLIEKDNLEDTGADERVILKCVFKKWDGDTWT
jgi:hypothetical protein